MHGSLSRMRPAAADLRAAKFLAGSQRARSSSSALSTWRGTEAQLFLRRLIAEHAKALEKRERKGQEKKMTYANYKQAISSSPNNLHDTIEIAQLHKSHAQPYQANNGQRT